MADQMRDQMRDEADQVMRGFQKKTAYKFNFILDGKVDPSVADALAAQTHLNKLATGATSINVIGASDAAEGGDAIF